MRRIVELLPAASLIGLITAVSCAVQLLPFGRTRLLVHLHDASADTALVAAAAAGAALVSMPAPGYAVVYGDATQVRGALGLAVPWGGLPGCGAML